ncbi:SpoIIE family protein phosphatase [Kitasatospora sp. NPDC006697]|uniref:SpoIIE family protein phosphatase n=1 Tax=Kitasatospora sp. NPDC006697 TaxID=3364020 RepID=UPI0036A7B9D6
MDLGTPASSARSRSVLGCVRRLLRATSAAELLAAVLAEGPQWITNEGSALYLLDGGGMLRLTVSSGLPEWAAERFGTIDPGSDLPAAQALRHRAPFLLSPERTGADYPNRLAGLGTGLVAVVTLPLIVDEQELGVLTLPLAHRGTVPRRDLEALETIAEVCAHRLAHLLHHVSAAGVRPAPRPPAGEHPGGRPSLVGAVRAAGAGAFERDLVTGESAWDTGAYQAVGRTPPAGPGPHPAPEAAELMHPEDLPDAQAALAEALARGGPYRLSFRVPGPDGPPRRVDELGEVLLDVHGRPVGIAGLLLARPPEPDRAPERRDSQVGARSALLLALTRALSRAVTVHEVTTVLTDVARPALGAASAVLDLVDEGRLLPVSPSVYGGAHRGELNRLHELSSEVREQSPARAVPLFSEPGGTAAPAGTGGPAAWAVLPLVASGRQVGSCLVTFAAEREFTREDRTLYSAFAGILAQSLERARLYDTQHHRASELQRAILPRSLPALPGLHSAARYLPSTEGMQIGGDWYDLIPLPSGRVGLVIGDVQGHNAEATAVMGQLRSGLRAYATDGHDPAATLARTSRLLAELDTDLFATCLYLTLDLDTGELAAARAGHPPPVRIGRTGAAELPLPGGPPLGVDPAAEYPLTRARLAPGETLLAYTDGLVEDRDEDYDESVQRMIGGIDLWYRKAGAADGLDRLADLLTLNVTERHSRPDDVALLLIHRAVGPED